MPNLATARAQRFHAYVERLSTALGHRDRHGPLRAYVTGLCLPGDRKSIEPMAARVDPRHVRARHQSMHHFVANAAWDDVAVLRAARETVLAALERHGRVAAWVIDDTGMPKKGRHSVGVARQYCGVLGKQDNWLGAPGGAPRPPPKYRGRGRPPTLVRRTGRHRPLSGRALAQHLPARAWRTVTWRQGTRGAMRSRFAAVRVRPAHRDDWRSTPRPEEWLLIEWPRAEAAPIKYWLSTLPPMATRAHLVRLAMLRWRIERDYQELKDELGLDHFEGRGWRGFHHHATLCIAAYAFLAAERLAHFPPEPLAFLQPPRVPKRFTPRGAPRAS